LGNSSDTVVINNVSNCNPPTASFNTQLEDCFFDYNSVNTGYLSQVILPVYPNDSLTLIWIIEDTNNNNTFFETYAGPISSVGCYEFSLTLFCSLKSPNLNTIIVNGSLNLDFVQLNEFNIEKHVVKVVDFLGRPASESHETLLIYHYSDGSIEKKYKND
jgi:hypothetical protein